MKTAKLDHPIHPLLSERWSPYAFSGRDVSAQILSSLYEAARWAPSCFNAQPWSFLVAKKGEDPAGFERLASCIVEANSWSRQAPVLLLTVAELNFARNGNPNRHAQHDLGMAIQNLTLQAQELGLCLHQMGGFDAQKASEVLGIPAGFEPMAMVALGYPGDPVALPEELATRDLTPRERKPISDFVFGAGWQLPSAKSNP